MPAGKRAGERCAHLTGENLCALYHNPERPQVCSDFPPAPDTCGGSFDEAIALMDEMERATAPGPSGD